MKTVRYATAADLHTLAEISAAAWEKAYDGIIPESHADTHSVESREGQLRRAISSRTEDAAVVEEGGEILGFTVIGPSRDQDMAAENGAEIRGLYVSPSHWRKGLGRLLTEWALKELRKQGYGIVTLWVLERSEMAAKFYESMGFARDGGMKEIGPGAPRVVRYRLSLRSSRASE